MEIQGKIKTIFPSQVIGQNGFEKRDLVITTEEQYPSDIIIQFTQQRCDLLNSVQVGQKVKVHFNLRGREWTNPQGEVKYFNTVEGWKIELIQTTNVASQQPQYQQQPPQGYAAPTYQQAPQGQYQQPVPQQAPPAPAYQQGKMFNNMGQAPQDESDLPF